MKKPKIPVVNENDEIIGYKDFDEIDPKKDIYRVSALWVTNSKGEVLIAQRKFTKKHDPGKWGPAVAGTVDEGETYEDNIYKEAKEELGIEGVKFDIGPKERAHSSYNFFGQWFTLKLDHPLSDFKIQEDEVEEIAWVLGEKLREDVRKNPGKYTPTMSHIVELLLGKNSGQN